MPALVFCEICGEKVWSGFNLHEFYHTLPLRKSIYDDHKITDGSAESTEVHYIDRDLGWAHVERSRSK